jgi:predicted PhzF superfamily epimerase YddE/YHI9
MILYFEVHSFTDNIFQGNPAGVCPLDEWIDDELMQNIAKENGLSETAFFVPGKDGFDLRWFTPVMEVDLCGHATLATAYVLFDHLEFEGDMIVFHTQSGDLMVSKMGTAIVMNFPSLPADRIDAPDHLLNAFDCEQAEVYKARDYMVVLDSEEAVRKLRPDFSELEQLDCTGIIVTAPGNDVDFVSRFFAPAAGIPEDPVTGSAHCTLTPYWAAVLGATDLSARQISERGGELACRLVDDRVHIAGRAVLYSRGFLNID